MSILYSQDVQDVAATQPLDAMAVLPGVRLLHELETIFIGLGMRELYCCLSRVSVLFKKAGLEALSCLDRYSDSHRPPHGIVHKRPHGNNNAAVGR